MENDSSVLIQPGSPEVAVRACCTTRTLLVLSAAVGGESSRVVTLYLLKEHISDALKPHPLVFCAGIEATGGH